MAKAPREQVTIYHNPKCSKSRQTLALLEERGVRPQVVEYLKTPLDAGTISALIDKLGISAHDLLRKKEPEFKELGVTSFLEDRSAVIDAMIQHPILIERPIVVVGNRARIGRPPEAVIEILEQD